MSRNINPCRWNKADKHQVTVCTDILESWSPISTQWDSTGNIQKYLTFYSPSWRPEDAYLPPHIARKRTWLLSSVDRLGFLIIIVMLHSHWTSTTKASF